MNSVDYSQTELLFDWVAQLRIPKSFWEQKGWSDVILYRNSHTANVGSR